MVHNQTAILLRAATPVDLRTAASWIASTRDCEQWTGPRFTFPLDIEALLRAIDFSSQSVFALADGPDLIAFGQLLRKPRGRGHLARLIVNPARRGTGQGETIVRRLLATAREASLEPVSLNVAEGNTPALSLYEKLGFKDAARPADEPDVPGARYLERSMSIRGVVFDLFHTLTGRQSERTDLPWTADVLGIDRRRWDELLTASSKSRLTGAERDPYGIVRSLAHQVDPSIPEERIREAVTVRIRRFRDTLLHVPNENLELLRRLKAAGLKLGLVSNADAMEVAAWADGPLAGVFDAEVFSCDVGYMKPEPEIYESCLRTLGLRAGDCLFVGDGGSNELVGARNVGMSTVFVSGVVAELWPDRVPERLLLCDHHVRQVPERPEIVSPRANMSMHFRTRAVTLALLFSFARVAGAQSVVGIIGIPLEITPIERVLQDVKEVVVRGYVFRTGTLNGRPVVVGRSGTGKVNAAIITTLLIDEFAPSAILFSGTAGAIDLTLNPGDVVVAETIAQHDVGVQNPNGITRRGTRNVITGQIDPLLVTAPEALVVAARKSIAGMSLPSIKDTEGKERVPRIVEGVIVTGDVFMADPTRREELRRTLHATAVEMEGGAMVQACNQFHVSCLVVRGITDRADPQAENSYQQYIAVASQNAAALVTAIIGRLDVGAGLKPAR